MEDRKDVPDILWAFNLHGHSGLGMSCGASSGRVEDFPFTVTRNWNSSLAAYRFLDLPTLGIILALCIRSEKPNDQTSAVHRCFYRRVGCMPC